MQPLEQSVSSTRALPPLATPIVTSSTAFLAMSTPFTNYSNEFDSIAHLVINESAADPFTTPVKAVGTQSESVSSPHANVKNLVSVYSALHTKSTPVIPTVMKPLRSSLKVSYSVASPSVPKTSEVTPSPSEASVIEPFSPYLSPQNISTDTEDISLERSMDEGNEETKSVPSVAYHVRSIISRLQSHQEKASTAEGTETEVNASRVRALILENEAKIREKLAALEESNRKPSGSKPMRIRVGNVPNTNTNPEVSPRTKGEDVIDTTVIPITMTETDTYEAIEAEDESISTEETDMSSTESSLFSKSTPSAVDVHPKTVPPSAIQPTAAQARISSTTARHIVAPANKSPSSLNIKLNNRSPIDKSTIKFTVPSHIVPKLVFPATGTGRGRLLAIQKSMREKR